VKLYFQDPSVLGLLSGWRCFRHWQRVLGEAEPKSEQEELLRGAGKVMTAQWHGVLGAPGHIWVLMAMHLLIATRLQRSTPLNLALLISKMGSSTAHRLGGFTNTMVVDQASGTAGGSVFLLTRTC
jgi:hypothetical protein